MRVIVVNNNFDLRKSGGGGSERYALDVSRGLEERGYQVIRNQCQLPLPRADFVYVNNCDDPAVLREASKQPSARFIHDHQNYCPGTAKYWFNSQKQCPVSAGMKCLFYAQKERCLSRNPARGWAKIRRQREALATTRQFRQLFVASAFMKAMLVANGIPANKIQVNRLFPYKNPAIRKKKGKKEQSPPLILFVGRIFKEKGVAYLLRACALLKRDFRLKIVGDGWDRESCQQLARRLPLRGKVEFTGFLPPRKVASLYQQARLIAVPSVWPEPFGLVGLEAGQHRKPVVAFDSGGIGEWLKDGENGFLAPRLDIRQFAQKMERLLSDKELAERMGKAGSDLVAKEFSFSRHLDKLEKAINEATK